MPLNQSLASFALYLLDQKHISSFSACCLTAKGERAGEGGGQKQKKRKKESCQENCSGRQAKEAPRTPQGEF